jgi:NADH-quinone oxidoreductase subunit C
MGPEEVAAALVTALAGEARGDGEGVVTGERAVTGEGVVTSVSAGDRWARATVDVPAGLWRTALRLARDELGCDFFDWLTAVDELDQGYAVVAHVWSTAGRYGVIIRTRVPGQEPAVESIVGLYPGAAWHERETHEMFGIDFPGHPDLAALLLPVEFEGHPLRKAFVLASRVAKQWPGAAEPGESAAQSAQRRRPLRPPGVPGPGEWGDGREGRMGE